MKAADNTLLAVKVWLTDSLSELYAQREVANISVLIIEQLFGWKRSEQVLYAKERLSESQMLRIVRVKDQLKSGRPIQYVLGATEFYGMKLKVNESVLIPRPETEELVQWVLTEHGDSAYSILDVGTGSGCIALALKSGRPHWKVHALDVSDTALRLASENAHQLGLDIFFHQGDMLSHPPTGEWDIIVSNPPYVLESDKGQMTPQVLEFEPGLALFVADEDPLVFYRSIRNYALETLKPKGHMYFEIHEAKGQELLDLFSGPEWEGSEIRQDLQGKERMLHVVKS